jgi:hypothetical protein
MSKGQNFFLGGGTEKIVSRFGRNSAPDENISAPPRKKFYPDEKNLGHASV